MLDSIHAADLAVVLETSVLKSQKHHCELGSVKSFSCWRTARAKDKALSCLDVTLKVICCNSFTGGRFKLRFKMQRL